MLSQPELSGPRSSGPRLSQPCFSGPGLKRLGLYQPGLSGPWDSIGDTRKELDTTRVVNVISVWGNYLTFRDVSIIAIFGNMLIFCFVGSFLSMLHFLQSVRVKHSFRERHCRLIKET